MNLDRLFRHFSPVYRPEMFPEIWVGKNLQDYWGNINHERQQKHEEDDKWSDLERVNGYSEWAEVGQDNS